jgi:hypothetical protein
MRSCAIVAPTPSPDPTGLREIPGAARVASIAARRRQACLNR